MDEVLIIDYGLGNLNSVYRAIRYLGGTPVISADPKRLLDARQAILPGVGAFGTAMQYLNERDLIEAIHTFAESGRPLLGICLGMELFLSASVEMGVHQGLGLVEGCVRRFPEMRDGDHVVKIPHIGWSGLLRGNKNWHGSLLDNVKEGGSVYFVHSYYVVPDRADHVLAYAQYGSCCYCAVVARDNVIGCQFHPEKSGEAGLSILKNFLEMH